MALENSRLNRSSTPTGSGRSSPAPRVVKRTIEEAAYKSDKTLRRYGATIERALNSWEISPQEWADYIAFLGRLLKAIQTHPKDVSMLPHSDDIAYKLAQCLNPALPSGVHQKALEVYEYVFGTFGNYISDHFHDFLPGLSAVLSFASLSVRPSIYSIYENHIIQLPPSDLRHVLKSLILSLLPALEEESSEDFERAFGVLQKLELKFSEGGSDFGSAADRDGYFWQCLFLGVITSPSKRQGALNFLNQRLPKFGAVGTSSSRDAAIPAIKKQSQDLSSAAELVISPEPGLLVRCFVCGLLDAHLLIQRGFLDLLVSNVPLDSPLLQARVGNDDFDRLISAAMQVLLRREMSLNRRLWSWFLGPDQKTNGNGSQSSSPTLERSRLSSAKEDQHFEYFSFYGRAPLERCILAMFQYTTTNATEKAHPFRICLSLMDRWEIGGSVIPDIFIPAIRSAYVYSQSATSAETQEVLRSASLFFDGVEAGLIWAKLLGVLQDTSAGEHPRESVGMFRWTVQNFNIKDEEMLTVHIPLAVAFLLTLLVEPDNEPNARTQSAILDAAATLLDLVPGRAFHAAAGKDEHAAVPPLPQDAKAVQKVLLTYYQTIERSKNGDTPIPAGALLDTLFRLTTSLLSDALEEEIGLESGPLVSILLALQTKTLDSKTSIVLNVLSKVFETLEEKSKDGRLLRFPIIGSVVLLLSMLEVTGRQHMATAATDISTIGAMLSRQLWQYLSPDTPKYHVEAVRSIWQLQQHPALENCIESSLTALVRGVADNSCALQARRPDSVKQFAVLWDHSIPASSSSTTYIPKGLTRRGSAMPNLSDSKQALKRQRVLAGPLKVVLDHLDEPREPCSDAVTSWLHNLPTLDVVFQIHLSILEELASKLFDISQIEAATTPDRMQREHVRELNYIFGHMYGMLRTANEWTWQCLTDMSITQTPTSNATTGFAVLAEYCCQSICSDIIAGSKTEQTAMYLLDTLLSAPLAPTLKPLETDSRLMCRLMSLVSEEGNCAQGSLLTLIQRSLRLRAHHESPHSTMDARPESSKGTKRSSLTAARPSPDASTLAPGAAPPPELTNFLQLGFSSPVCRPHLGQWSGFLSSILPIFADAIFTSLIPLVDCMCVELDKAYNDLVAMATTDFNRTMASPEEVAIALLDALNLILARAHECLIGDQAGESTPIKPPGHSRSLLSNVASGVFKAEGPPSKTAQANSRLTVVLAFQDAIRASSKLWTWATSYSSSEDLDKASAATSTYNALRVRNRTRHLLGEMFMAEPLESLEVLISKWWHSTDQVQANAALDLLHVLQGLRPSSLVPTIMDALCSRINPALLPITRQSCQTSDLTALEIALFLSAYLNSIEDDAMDEIWPDCMAFLRDILSNPLPYRQVLPSLLSTTLLLAQKMGNTNFGEQRKMRRELGDIFLRMLAATFTAMPAGAMESRASSALGSNATDERSINLFSVLEKVVRNIEVILESADRVNTAINSISNSLVGLVLHAKAFPTNITSDFLALLLQMAKQAPFAKTWRKELLDSFNDPRLMMSSASIMETGWFPLFQQWCMHEKDRMPEIVSRLTAPTSAGIMFGVGASAARLEADRRAQLNLRRLCLLLLACQQDSFVTMIRGLEEKLVELFEATASSSPSSAIKAELFMLCRALVLTMSALLVAPLWPTINRTLQSALLSLLPSAADSTSFANLPLLQACKLLDLLVTISPDEFQLHEWLYITDTIDAVYQPSQWAPTALSDQVAEALDSEGLEDMNSPVTPTASLNNRTAHRKPLLDNSALSDSEDIKVMARDDFARVVIKPFLGQLSLRTYEGVYGMDTPDIAVCRRNLLEDLLDLTTVVE